MKFERMIKQEVEVAYLQAEMGVRYWEDARVNGMADDEDDLGMPFAEDDTWRITIDLVTGRIADWPAGTVAETHYKVCDDGVYRLLDQDKNVIAEKSGYVPTMLSPGGNSWGDYVIMNIGADGTIENWRADLSYFKAGDE